MATEAELFAIRCSINQAIYLLNTKKIFVVMDSIYTARRIFDLLSSHPYQFQSAAILKELRKFFKRNINNSIKFCDCPSNTNGLSIKELIKKPKNSIFCLSFCANYHEILARKVNTILSLTIGRWLLKCQMSKIATL